MEQSGEFTQPHHEDETLFTEPEVVSEVSESTESDKERERQEKVERIMVQIETRLVELVNEKLGKEHFQGREQLLEYLETIPPELSNVYTSLNLATTDLRHTSWIVNSITENPNDSKVRERAIINLDMQADSLLRNDKNVLAILEHASRDHTFETNFPEGTFEDLKSESKQKADQSDFHTSVLAPEYQRSLEINQEISSGASPIAKAIVERLTFWNKQLADVVESSKQAFGIDDNLLIEHLIQCRGKLNEIRNQTEQRLAYSEQLEELVHYPEYQKELNEVDDEELKQQLNVREQVLFHSIFGKEPFNVGDAASQRQQYELYRLIGPLTSKDWYIDGTDPSNKVGWHEPQVVYSAFLLSPTQSTTEFVGNLQHAIDGLEQHAQSIRSLDQLFNNNPVTEMAVRSLWNQFHEGKLQGWQGKRVIEVGGVMALESLKQSGAEVVATIWDSQPGYGFDLHGLLDNNRGAHKLLTPQNYQEFADPHSIDMICTSRVFDAGSGVERSGVGPLVNAMSELLKDKGFMIHFDNVTLDDWPERYGSERIMDTASGARIYRYHEKQEAQEGEAGA